MKKYLLYSFAVLLLFSCTSGKNSLEKGNYYDAVTKSINRLRQNSSHKKAASTLRQAYPMAIEYYSELIEQEKKSNNQFKYGNIASYMYAVNNMANDISRCPGAKRVISNAKRYDNELPNVEKNAAEERYIAGMEALKINSRESAIDAYYHFKRCVDYVPNYKNANEKIIEAKEYATLKVVLEKIPPATRKYKFSAGFFQDNIESMLADEFQRRAFIRLYTPQEAERVQLIPHHVIRIEFLDFSVGNTHTREISTEIIGKDSVEIGDVKTKTGKVAAYGLPKATLKTFTKEVMSKGELLVVINEFESGKVLLHNKIPGEYKWFTQWATYEGDIRALDTEQKQLLKNRPAAPPSDQDLFIEFTKPIFAELQRIMKEFYKHY